MKPILAIDLDGALLKSRPFEKAHKRWFSLMSILLKDKSINDYAGLENYFDKVDKIMKRYLGDVDSEHRIIFARNLFSMATVAEAETKDLVDDFVRYLQKIKKKYRLALITTAPETSVDPILEKVGCADLFDIIYKSPVKRYPNKKELFQQCIEEYGKPLFYIGNGDKDIISCKELGIPSISVAWVSSGKVKGDYDINKVKELEKIIP